MFKLNARKQSPAGVVFASDPLLVSMSEGINTLYSGDGREFRCLLSSAGEVNISDIVETWATPLPEPSTASWLEQVESWADGTPREVYTRMKKSVIGQAPEKAFATYVIPGRTSAQNLKLFPGDIFSGRLLNQQGNPFLTTRTHKGIIIMKETELAPLYFIQDNDDIENISLHLGGDIPPLHFRDESLLRMATTGRGVYAIDMKLGRRAIFDDCGLLVSTFIIRKGGRIAAEVFIEKAEPAKERHLLRFRNSFGVFEVIELTGELTREAQFVDSNEFKKYRREFNRFDNERRRPNVESVLTVSTGPKRRRELLHLLDCLASDEVWLLGYGLTPVKVIPEVKSVTIPERQEEPQSVDLTLHPVYSEPAIMPDISKSNASYIRKIFTNVFDNKFT